MAFGRSTKRQVSDFDVARVSKRRPATRYGRGYVVTDALDEDIDTLKAEVSRLRDLLDQRCPPSAP